PLRSIGIVDIKTGEPLRTGDIIPEIAVDNDSGALYVVWQDARFSGLTRDGIAFSRSADGGLTWSNPVQINKVPREAISTTEQTCSPRCSAPAQRKAAISATRSKNR